MIAQTGSSGLCKSVNPLWIAGGLVPLSSSVGAQGIRGRSTKQEKMSFFFPELLTG